MILRRAPREVSCQLAVPRLVVLILLLVAPMTNGAGADQNQPLGLTQIEKLVRLQTPDSTVAAEIRHRGLDFVPTKNTLERLRSLGAGPETLQAIDEFRPMLDEAKKVIPPLLKSIYQALNEGNPQAIRPMLSSGLVTNPQKLDAICKPFKYRSHYVEAIIERPKRQFEVRVRVLFTPIDEHAYILFFGVSQDHFFLQDIADPSNDWFGPQLEEAENLVRNFVYALGAGRKDIAAKSLSPGLLSLSSYSSGLLKEIRDVEPERVEIHEGTRLESYKGLKIRVCPWIFRKGVVGIMPNLEVTFLVDSVQGQLRIVSWAKGCGFFKEKNSVDDPSMEPYTLKRFGLATSASLQPTNSVSAAPAPAESSHPLIGEPPSSQPSQLSSAQPMSTGAQPQPGSTAPSAVTKRFYVRHRHRGVATSYCEGWLIVMPSGTVGYACTKPDTTLNNRCERGHFPSIKEVELYEGGLRITLAQGGNWDFFGAQSDIQSAYAAILAYTEKGRKPVP